jgi:hypothetical protein
MTSAATGRDATVPGGLILLLLGAGCAGAIPLAGGVKGRSAGPAVLGGGLGMYSPGAVVGCPAPGEPIDGVDPPIAGGATYGFGAGGE